jgi:hypothetical protein
MTMRGDNMKWKDIESVSDLRRGDEVTNKATGEALTVARVVEGTAVAVRSVVLTDGNVDDWLVRRPDHEPVSWWEGEAP